MSAIEYHYQTIGRILAYLVSRGLARVDLGPDNAMDIMTERRGDESEVIATFRDCVYWMRDEGLIRIANETAFLNDTVRFAGVQLTSAGIALIKAETNDNEIGESIEKRVTESGGGNLDSSIYTKIGEFAGSFLGGLTKSLSSG